MKKLLILLMLSLVLAAASSAWSAQRLDPGITPAAPGSDLVDESTGLWFVQLRSAPAIDGTKLSTLKNEKAAFRGAAKKAGLQYTERFAFDTLWNGLSVEIDPRSLGKLARIPGVAGVFPVIEFQVPEPFASEAAYPDLLTAIAMTGADIAQSSLGYTGTGIKVAVMDTGIDYDHPDLGGCFGPGCRVEFGYDFVGDAYTGPGSPITPDPDPDDCHGHGTHVAGIVGASGGLTGVAPDVTFGAYRVFGCGGSTGADIMIAAMEAALADGMDVLNMSIGSSYQWPQYPTAVASDNAVNAGMVVVASIGNSGSTGAYSAGAPGVGKKVIGVASFDNTHVLSPYFEVNATKIAYNTMSFSVAPPTAGSEEIVYVGRGCNVDLPHLADPSGKVALIVRGACTFFEKASNAEAAGATAAVIFNSSPGNFFGTLGGPGVTIPVVSISQADGQFIDAQADPTTMTWTDQVDLFPSATGGLISSFSSYGLAPDLSLKPDIGAPGGSIFSTLPLEFGGYGYSSGTSMSSPHVAGAAALLAQAHPNMPSQKFRRVLQNSADPALWSLVPGFGLYDSVHRQGAGMLDIDDSILATTVIEPGKLSLGEMEFAPYVHTLELENNGPVGVTYDLSEEWGTIATVGTFAADLGYWLLGPSVAMPPSVFVPAGGTATVDLTFFSPTGGFLPFTYGGYILFSPQGGGQEYRVPYAGYDGDYQLETVLYNNCCGLPWLMGGPVFTMVGADIPDFWVILAHQSRKFRMEVFDAHTGKAWHRAYDLDYVGRNSSGGSFFSFPWDGTTVNGKKVNTVPDGDYEVVISVLRAGGDGDNPAHWETWTSPVITIDRP